MKRVAERAPSKSHWAPWTDKKGRFDPVRAATLGLLLLPALALAIRLPLGLLGARPINAAIHSTGFWAVVWLVASLAVSPAKAIFTLPGIVVLRRMIGNAALGYALAHLLLYCADQNWRLLTVVSEIAKRFYLTIGFVALVGLIVLGATSTDSAIRRMGPRWKRLHKWVYGIAVLALFHFILQTKADVSLPLLFVGVFAWEMIWRSVPVGRDRTPWGLALVAVGAGVATVAIEWLWYRFGTHIDPNKVIGAETDITFGLGPSDQVAVAGLCVVAGLWWRRASQGRAGERMTFWILSFAGGAAINELVVFAFGIDRYLEPGDWTFVYQDLAWAALLGVLGFVHWRLRGEARVKAVDFLALCCVAFPITLSTSATQLTEGVFASAIALLWAVMAWQTWRETKAAAIGLVPLAVVMAFGIATQM